MTPENTYGSIGALVGVKAIAKLLHAGQYPSVTQQFAQIDMMGRNQGDTVKWRRFHNLPRATAPMTDGISPEGKKLTSTDITATIEYYGDNMDLTRKVADTIDCPVLNEMMKKCGIQAGETLEEVNINFMKAGSNAYYANGAASRAYVGGPATEGDFRKIFRAFKRNKAQEFREILKASGMVSTQPVEAAYFVLGHTDCYADLAKLAGFIKTKEYPQSKGLDHEYGSFEQFRFILTPMFEPWLAAATSVSSTEYMSSGAIPSEASNPDVYPLLVIAQDSYAVVPLKGYKNDPTGGVRVAVYNPGTPSPVDRNGMSGFVSWTIPQTGAILNHSWIARVEVAVTADPSET